MVSIATITIWSAVKAERSKDFDVGLSQMVLPRLTLGFNGSDETPASGTGVHVGAPQIGLLRTIRAGVTQCLR